MNTKQSISLVPEPAESEANKAQRLIDFQGWCLLRAQALNGEVIVLERDAAVCLPGRWCDDVVYTLSELDELGVVTQARLRRVHEAKRMFRAGIIKQPGPGGEAEGR
jgi:hypothetical protein